jgi:adenine deaminase
MIRIAALALVASPLASSQACLTEHIARAAKNSTSSICVSSFVSANSKLAIKNAGVFNGSGFQNAQTVIVSNDKIVTIGGIIPAGINIIDGTGKFLIPGLFDSHVHPVSCSNLAELAGYGVTTAINMACLNYTTCS